MTCRSGLQLCHSGVAGLGRVGAWSRAQIHTSTLHVLTHIKTCTRQAQPARSVDPHEQLRRKWNLPETHWNVQLIKANGPLNWAYPISRTNLEPHLVWPVILKHFPSFSQTVMPPNLTSLFSSILGFSRGFQLFHCLFFHILFPRQLISEGNRSTGLIIKMEALGVFLCLHILDKS